MTLRRTPWRRKPKPHRDPVLPQVYAAVRERDRGCIGPRIGMSQECYGPVEIDHVRSGGMGFRSPSVGSNLACLCSAHHRVKTEGGRKWRPRIIEWIREKEEQ